MGVVHGTWIDVCLLFWHFAVVHVKSIVDTEYRLVFSCSRVVRGWSEQASIGGRADAIEKLGERI